MANQPLYQILDAQGRIIGNYLLHQTALEFVQYLQVQEARMGADAVTLQLMPGQ